MNGFEEQPIPAGEQSSPAAPSPVAPESWPVWGYSDLAIMFFVAITCLLLAGLAMAGLMFVLPFRIPGRATPLIIGQFLGFGLALVGLRYLLKVRYAKPFWEAMAWHGSPRGVIRSMFLGPPLAFAIAIGGAALGQDQADMPLLELLKDPVSIALLGIAAVTIGPVCEELAFRGFLLPVLVRSFGAAVGVVLAALPFALLHGPQYGWSWQRVLLILLAGCAFGIARLRAGSTMAATAMHATYNLTFFTAFLAQKGFHQT